MSEHRRKQQSGRGDSPANGRSQQPPPGPGGPQQGPPPGPGGPQQGPRGGYQPGPGGGQAGPPRRTSAQPQLTRAEMRKAAQSKGRRGGGAANEPQGGGRRGGRGPGGPTGPKPKRFLDYPRWGKRGVRRWLPSWKQILSGFLLMFACLVGLIGYAYAKTTVPSPNATTQMQSNTYYWANGTEMVQRGAYFRQNVPLTAIPTDVQNDFLAAENATFWTDKGVDPQGILRAVYDMAKGGEVQSGSTITQQWIKNTRLNQGQTLSRKLDEILMSIKVGSTVPKQTVLDGYLNTSYFGRSAYGIDAAAEAYYGISSDKLTIGQGAFLASLVNGPSIYDPTWDSSTGTDTDTVNATNVANAKARWNYVMSRNLADKFITQAQYDTVTAQGFPMPIKPVSNSSESGYIGYLVTLADNNLLRTGVTPAQLDAGGYQIYTTFVKSNMDAMKSAVDNELLKKIDPKVMVTDTQDATTAPDYNKQYPVDQWVHVGGASVVPGSGAVTAIYGGPDFMKQETDDADNPSILVGSTFKAFVLAAALTDGVQSAGGSTAPGTPVSLNSLYNGDPNLEIKNPDGTVWLDQNHQPWYQANDSTKKWGPITLTQAMAQSVNTVYVQLGMDVGMQKVAAAAVAAGVSPSSLAPDQNVPSFALGTSTPGPIRLATAYATFADDGVEYDPYEVDHYVLNENGQATTVSLKSKPKQAFSPQVAETVTTALKAVVSSSGTGANALALGRDAAGKTGTTDSYKSAWFVGYTKQLSTAIGLFDQDPKNFSLLPLMGLGGQQQVYGADFPTAIWTDYMEAALNGQPQEKLDTANYGTIQNELGVSPSPSASATPSMTASAPPSSAPPSKRPSAPPSSAAPSITPSAPVSSSPSCDPLNILGNCSSPSPSESISSSSSWSPPVHSHGPNNPGSGG
ncbi:transglycosylase domain-containing protein [Streptacidiphilus sp. P02-A3a]|uniref:transglycosylase domain-containing protein n=1 Tax=Streptacidiphilus sp. P02-A3a TaxID=2704468 RepID=UPI0015F820E2|nr:transglycosylase domain-containing protein [Streptacidiphilus sp. P02-A3a]QMU73475.1 penicillin-binding protein [Streptacidiphilus sp. P02-A3a]